MTTERNNVMKFVLQLVSHKWNEELLSRFQFNISTKVNIRSDELYNLVNEIKDVFVVANKMGNIVYVIEQNDCSVVIYIGYRQFRYEQYDGDIGNMLCECSKLFGAMAREIKNVKKMTNLNIKCAYDLGPCCYNDENIDYFSPTIYYGQPVRLVNRFFSRMANEQLSLKTFYDKSDLHAIINAQSFMNALQIIPSETEFVVLFGW